MENRIDKFLKSNVALRHGIDNTPKKDDIFFNLQRLERTYEKIEKQFPKIFINSGYRSFELNHVIRGARNSAHMSGCAMDIECPGISNKQLWEWIRDNTDFEQLILENHNEDIPSSGWVHISIEKDELQKPKKEVLIKHIGGGYERV